MINHQVKDFLGRYNQLKYEKIDNKTFLDHQQKL